MKSVWASPVPSTESHFLLQGPRLLGDQDFYGQAERGRLLQRECAQPPPPPSAAGFHNPFGSPVPPLAWAQGKPIQVSRVKELEKSLLVTGFGYNHNGEILSPPPLAQRPASRRARTRDLARDAVPRSR